MLHCVTEKSRHFIVRISNDTFHEMHNLINSSLVGISILRIFCVGLWWNVCDSFATVACIVLVCQTSLLGLWQIAHFTSAVYSFFHNLIAWELRFFFYANTLFCLSTERWSPILRVRRSEYRLFWIRFPPKVLSVRLGWSNTEGLPIFNVSFYRSTIVLFVL